MSGGGREVRDKGLFVKMIFTFNESHAHFPYQLKIHVRGATSAMLTPRLTIYGLYKPYGSKCVMTETMGAWLDPK